MFTSVFSATAIAALFPVAPEIGYWFVFYTVMITGFDFFAQAAMADKVLFLAGAYSITKRACS